MSVRKMQRLTLAFLCLALACTKTESSDVNVAKPIVADAVIQVHNRTTGVLTIYIETDRLVDQLGSVAPASTHSFSIPSAIARSADELYLEARGRSRQIAERSSKFQLSQGTRVVWTISRNGNGAIAVH